MTIRLAQQKDLRAIQNCAARAYEIYIECIGKKPAPMVADFKTQIEAGVMSVAIDEIGELAGFITFFPKGNRMFLENVAVLPNQQHNGIGKQLISYCENEASRLNFQTIELYTNEKMTENLTLYPHLGFEEIERREENGFNRVYFQKRL